MLPELLLPMPVPSCACHLPAEFMSVGSHALLLRGFSCVQCLQSSRPRYHDGCMLLLRFLTKSLDLETDKAAPADPGIHLAFEAYIEILEVVATVAILGLTGTAFLPQLYVDIQVPFNPCMLISWICLLGVLGFCREMSGRYVEASLAADSSATLHRSCNGNDICLEAFDPVM